MIRECLAVLVVCQAAGCSLVLDFSEGAIPADASIDGPFSEQDCLYKEPNDVVDQAMVLDPAEVGPAAICPGDPADRDFYKFTVPANTASVTVKITFDNSLGDLDLRLTDPTGATTFAQSRGFANDETIVCPAASPACPMLAEGDYAFEVFAAQPGLTNRYDIALTLTPMSM
jgi:hypothetical protein